MSELANYIREHVERGACVCGMCIDAGKDPGKNQPTGHTADMIFFKVRMKNDPTADHLRELISSHEGEFCEVDPFDGKDHSYMELGGWLGDQGLAIMLIGLGYLLGIWNLLSPKMLGVDDEICIKMAEQGLLSLQYIRAQS